MPPAPVRIEGFSGLNLATEAFDVGLTGATDLLNVDFDWPGRLRTRDGTTRWNGTTLSASGYSALFGVASLGGVLLAVRYSSGGNVNVDQITSTGATTNLGSLAASANTFALSHTDFSVFPTLGSAAVISFVTTPSTGVQARSTLTNVGSPGVDVVPGIGKPLYVATTPTSNRLVAAGFFAAADSPSGSNGTRSTVFFSDPSTPGGWSGFTAANWVGLRPNDGEVIVGVVPFGNDLYVFKQSAFFVFYGESTDATGNPIFNYRRVDLPEPLSDPVSNAPFSTYVCTGPDGVYFSTSGGVWRTVGGTPERLSTAVGKIFSRDPTLSSSIENQSSALPPCLSWAGGRLFAGYTTSAAATRQLVYDPRLQQWTLYDLPTFAVAEYPPGASTFRDAVYYVRGSGDNNVYVQRPTASDDSGTAIPWSWTSGFGDMGSSDRKVLDYTGVSGYGSATVQWTPEDGRPGDPVASGTVSLGTRPTIASSQVRAAARGRRFQLKVSGSGQAAVSEVVPYVSGGAF